LLIRHTIESIVRYEQLFRHQAGNKLQIFDGALLYGRFGSRPPHAPQSLLAARTEICAEGCCVTRMHVPVRRGYLS
jgi:hypothetical protein